MLPCSACKEVLDSVVLFAGEQRRSNEDSTLSLVISTDQGGGPEDNYWSVRVDVGGLGVYYLNERTFITKLYSTCAKLQQAPGSEGGEEGGRGGGEKNVMSVFSRKIGEYSTVQKHTIVISENGSFSDSMSVQSSVLPRPPDFPPYGLRIWFQLMKHRPEDMKREIEKLLFHMHLLHLTNSSMAMEMTVRDNSTGVLITTRQFPKEHGLQLRSSFNFTLNLSLRHFTSVETLQTKLKIVRGLSYSLTGLQSKDGRQLSFRVFSGSAIAPHLSLPRGRKIPAHRVCHRLQVYVYGPSGVPIMTAGSLSLVSLNSMAQWNNYGLSLSSTNQDTSNLDGRTTEVASGYCGLSECQRSSGLDGGAERIGGNHTLLLFIYLEPEDEEVTDSVVEEREDGDRGGGGGGAHWNKMIDIVTQLRNGIESLLLSQQKKFHQATHSALNKLLCNYGTHSKKSSIVRNALPQLANAVASIIRHSLNQEFKVKCRSILQMREEEQDRSERDVIGEKLWEMAESKVHVYRNITKHPLEPSSPELQAAVSNHQKPESEQRTVNSQSMAAETNNPPTSSASCTTIPSNRSPPTTSLGSTLSAEMTPVPTCASSASTPQSNEREIAIPGQQKLSLFKPTFISRRRSQLPIIPSVTTESSSAEVETSGVQDDGEEGSFEVLADIERYPNLTPQQANYDDKNVISSTGIQSTSITVTDSLKRLDQLPPTEGDVFFEELATASREPEEEDSFASIQPPATLAEGMKEVEEISGEMVDCYSIEEEEEEVMVEELMDWGEDSDEQEFLAEEEEEEEGEECWFSDFSNSENSTERFEKRVVEEPVNRRMKTDDQTEVMDSDWELLGEMADEPSPLYHPLEPVKTTMEPSSLSSKPSQIISYNIDTSAVVPDTSFILQAAILPTDMIINEEDFHWD